MAEANQDAYVAWSGGKDSTALTHIVSTEVPGVRVMSIKDDLDFPGEETYIRDLADQWGVVLDILRPGRSLQELLHQMEVLGDEDIHSRDASFGMEAFYQIIAGYRAERDRPEVYLGLRKEESYGRLMLRNTLGAKYTKADGEVVCQPLCDWRGIDVYAYLLSRDIPLLPLYQCVRLHDRPERVRKSWWVPGAAARKGGMVWLRTYYPSLYRRVREMCPTSSWFA